MKRVEMILPFGGEISIKKPDPDEGTINFWNLSKENAVILKICYPNCAFTENFWIKIAPITKVIEEDEWLLILFDYWPKVETIKTITVCKDTCFYPSSVETSGGYV